MCPSFAGTAQRSLTGIPLKYAKKQYLLKENKMKKIVKITACTVASCIALSFGFGLTACEKGGGPGETPPTPTDTVTITINECPETIRKGETGHVSATVQGSTDVAYTWSTSPADILAINNGELTVIAQSVSVDTVVTVTATAHADETVTASKSVIVKPVIEGQVADLTAAALQEIAGANITFEGTYTVYTLVNGNHSRDTEDVYHFTTKMEEDRWFGSYYYGENVNSAIEDTYVKGEVDTSPLGAGKHFLASEYIDKDNTVAQKIVKDYVSVPSYWEDSHYWNHISGLGENITQKFTHDPDHNELYAYKIEQSTASTPVGEYTSDEWLMTYLGYSLCPVYNPETDYMFDQFELILEDGHITGIQAQTQYAYNNPEYDMSGNLIDWDSATYNIMRLEIKEVGATTVPAPEQYSAPKQYGNLLEQALQEMQGAKNYTYHAVDTTTFMPSASGDEYMSSAVSGNKPSYVSSAKRTASVAVGPYYNHTVAEGTEGDYGLVTANGIVIEHTIFYSGGYEEGDDPYSLEYRGYRPMGNDDKGKAYYERFEFDSDVMALHGVERIYGDMFDSMPSFEFSPNVFEYFTMQPVNFGTDRLPDYKNVYVFQLRNGNITRDVAKEVSAHSYADDATNSLAGRFTVSVTEDGHLYSTNFPYELSSGQIGYIQTTYSKVGTTALAENAFGTTMGSDGVGHPNYVARVYRTEWDMFGQTKGGIDFDPNHTDSIFGDGYDDDATASTVLAFVFGSDYASKLPKPELLMNVFGDKLYGPWHEWDNKLVEGDAPKIRDYISINTEIDEVDENTHVEVTTWNRIVEELKTQLGGAGFSFSSQLTAKANASSTVADASRYAIFQNSSVIVVFENYRTTCNVFINIYKTGEYIE